MSPAAESPSLVLPVRFMAVDNHESVLESMTVLAERHPDQLRYLGGAATVEALDFDAPPPDVVVLDLFLGRDDTASTGAIGALVAWGARVLVYTSAEFPVPLRLAVAAGAAGVSLKNDGTDQLLHAILDVAAHGFGCSSALAQALLTDPRLAAELSPREQQIMQAVDDGLTHAQIGRRLGIGAYTVADHLKSVRSKYLALGRDVTNAHSIVREARRDGWLEPR